MRKFLLPLALVFSIFLLASCSDNVSKPVSSQLTQSTSEITQSDDAGIDVDIAQKTKDYILSGQEDKPEAEKIKWSERFIDLVDIDGLYQKYLSDDGAEDDIISFAGYLTQNAPVPDNWRDLTTADLQETYDEKASRFEHLEGDLYQVYIQKDGADVPYVVVNSRTGYFHG